MFLSPSGRSLLGIPRRSVGASALLLAAVLAAATPASAQGPPQTVEDTIRAGERFAAPETPAPIEPEAQADAPSTGEREAQADAPQDNAEPVETLDALSAPDLPLTDAAEPRDDAKDTTELDETKPPADELALSDTADEERFALPHLQGTLRRAVAEAEAEASSVAVTADGALRMLDRQARSALEQLGSLARHLEVKDSATLKRSGAFFDLTPHVAHAKWTEAVALLAENKCGDAAKAALEAVDPQARDAKSPVYSVSVDYAISRMEACSRNNKTRAEGKTRLRRIAKLDGPVGHLASKTLGGSHGLYAVAGTAERLGTMLRAVRVSAKKKGVRPALKELDALETAVNRSAEPWTYARMELVRAELLADAGFVDEAATLYLSLYHRTARWKMNAKVREGIERLERKTKKALLPFGARVDRMRELVAAGRNKDARKLSVANAKRRKASRKEQRGWKAYRLGLVAERKKERKKAIAHFEKANKLISDPAVRPRLYLGWARALRRMDRDPEAIALYARLCDEQPRDALCGDARYQSGRLRQFGGDLAGAINDFARLIGEFPDSPHAADALWRGGFSLHLSGDQVRARAAFAELESRFGEFEDRSDLPLGLKASYWSAMAALRAGDRATAEREFRGTLKRGPMTWYGRLATSRLVELGAIDAGRELEQLGLGSVRLRPSALSKLDGVFIPRTTRLEAAVELARLGFYTEALSESASQSEYFPRPAGARRLSAALHLMVDRPDRAHWIAKKEIEQGSYGPATIRDWGTAFPLSYAELGLRHGTEAGVDPFLVQAIIRQESGFRPAVRSWAGAVGLMQLMPGTARDTARRWGIKSKRKIGRRQLEKPEVNVKLGARYIRLHTAFARNHIPLALAGYNAGPVPLGDWMKRFGSHDLDAWVESITYQEARGYVRKVMTSYITYSVLYSGRLPSLSLKLPESLADWGDFDTKVSAVVSGPALAER